MNDSFEQQLAQVVNSEMKLVTARIQSKMDAMDQSLISMYKGESPDVVKNLIAIRIFHELGIELSPENLQSYTEAVVTGVSGKLVATQQML